MKTLTRGQISVLIATTIPMIAVGGFGGWGTYTNIVSEFGRAATAAGAVAAGEGVTLVAALVMLVLTMLGQSSPAVVRIFLWLGPLAASAMGVAVADTLTERILYALTPLGMCGAAEGIGLLARRVVVYRTDVDVEAQRRNTAILRRIAYHRARAERHPWKWVQRVSELAAWRLMGRLGHSDATLGSALIDVQNIRIVGGANTALADMFGSAPELPAATPRHSVAPPPATPKAPRATATEKTATPPPAEATPAGGGAPGPPVPCYEPGTPQYVVRELWLRLNHQPIQSAITAALDGAGLASSEQQARKIRSQVRRENPALPGPRAA